MSPPAIEAGPFTGSTSTPGIYTLGTGIDYEKEAILIVCNERRGNRYWIVWTWVRMRPKGTIVVASPYFDGSRPFNVHMMEKDEQFMNDPWVRVRSFGGN